MLSSAHSPSPSTSQTVADLRVGPAAQKYSPAFSDVSMQSIAVVTGVGHPPVAVIGGPSPAQVAVSGRPQGVASPGSGQPRRR